MIGYIILSLIIINLLYWLITVLIDKTENYIIKKTRIKDDLTLKANSIKENIDSKIDESKTKTSYLKEYISKLLKEIDDNFTLYIPYKKNTQQRSIIETMSWFEKIINSIK